jgi:predicted metal-dependent peptidase
MSTISTEEFNEISRELERHHGLFYQFWSLGRPVFVDDIPTAAVQFDCAGDCVLFMFNPEYWNKLCNYERCFVIAHECLHVSLNHGVRTIGIVDGPVNECLDVVVNELLVDKFGFDRSKLSDGEDYCWVDTVFPKEKDMPKDKSFEYYYSKANNPNVKINSSLVDVHSYLSAEEWDQIVEKINEELSDEEKAGLKDIIEKGHFSNNRSGQSGTGLWTFVSENSAKKKKKWETVIKKWSRKFLSSSLRDVEQWGRLNRRFNTLAAELFIPSEMEDEFADEKKIEVWFFLDSSGSCVSFAQRFYDAAHSLPHDKFNIKLFSFDTTVYPLEISGKKLRGGWGTSFTVIEKYIQSESDDGGYPEAVFIITDGYGNSVHPEKPERWHWFLTSQYKQCIPPECHIFNLLDFE